MLATPATPSTSAAPAALLLPAPEGFERWLSALLSGADDSYTARAAEPASPRDGPSAFRPPAAPPAASPPAPPAAAPACTCWACTVHPVPPCARGSEKSRALPAQLRGWRALAPELQYGTRAGRLLDLAALVGSKHFAPLVRKLDAEARAGPPVGAREGSGPAGQAGRRTAAPPRRAGLTVADVDP